VLVRTGGAGAPRALNELLNFVFWHPAHVVMQVRQLQQLRTRAEGLIAASAGGELRHEGAGGCADAMTGRWRGAGGHATMGP
jgi:hypothetical protein